MPGRNASTPAVFDATARRSASRPSSTGVPASSRQKSATGGETAMSPAAARATMRLNAPLSPTLGSEYTRAV